MSRGREGINGDRFWETTLLGPSQHGLLGLQALQLDMEQCPIA